MRIQSTDERKRFWENLREATDENARSKALDRAAQYYLRMCGGVAAYGRGNIQTLLDEAGAQGSLTAPKIAAILDERAAHLRDVREREQQRREETNVLSGVASSGGAVAPPLPAVTSSYCSNSPTIRYTRAYENHSMTRWSRTNPLRDDHQSPTYELS
jgi:hypothetical protein